MRGRTNTMTSTASKTSGVTTSKRIAPAPTKPRLNSDGTGTSSGATPVFMACNSFESHYSKPMKIITEVDGMTEELFDVVCFVYEN